MLSRRRSVTQRWCPRREGTEQKHVKEDGVVGIEDLDRWHQFSHLPAQRLALAQDDWSRSRPRPSKSADDSFLKDMKPSEVLVLGHGSLWNAHQVLTQMLTQFSISSRRVCMFLSFFLVGRIRRHAPNQLWSVPSRFLLVTSSYVARYLDTETFKDLRDFFLN